MNQVQRIHIRPVKAEDCKILFDWRNDEDARKQSFSSEPLEWEKHCEWFRRKLQSEETLMLIGESDIGPVGTVRFEKKDDECVVSIIVGMPFRGKGYGKSLLAEAIVYMKNQRFASGCVAEVKLENKASQIIFRACGFLVSCIENDRMLLKLGAHG